MDRKIKGQIIAFIIICILISIFVWYVTLPTQKYYKLPTLINIKYEPATTPTNDCSPLCEKYQACVNKACIVPLPIFTFTFSQPINPQLISNTTAFLKSFIPTNTTNDNTNDNVTEFISAMLDKGGVPFTPNVTSTTTIVANSAPSSITNQFTSPLTIDGVGEVWFAIPI